MEDAKRGNLDAIKHAVDADPKLANLSRNDGIPLLDFAAVNGHDDVVQYLLTNGALVDARTKYGTALHAAVEENHSKVVRTLLTWKANPNSTNDWGETPLHKTWRNKTGEIAEMLVLAGANVSAVDYAGRTALHRCKSLPVAKLLLDAGAEIDAQDSSGYNALHWAATPREIVDTPTMEFLIHRGIDFSAKDNNGRTPLELAEQSKQKKLIAILEKHTQNPSYQAAYALQERVQRSTAVLRISIAATKQSAMERRGKIVGVCEAKILEVFKGSNTLEKITFQFYPKRQLPPDKLPSLVGKEYIVFLHQIDTPYRMYDGSLHGKLVEPDGKWWVLEGIAGLRPVADRMEDFKSSPSGERVKHSWSRAEFVALLREFSERP